MPSLEEVKEIATEFLEMELYMFQNVSKLNRDDVLRFNEWYETNPHFVKLKELMQLAGKDKVNVI
jgi:hypothetical protein